VATDASPKDSEEKAPFVENFSEDPGNEKGLKAGAVEGVSNFSPSGTGNTPASPVEAGKDRSESDNVEDGKVLRNSSASSAFSEPSRMASQEDEEAELKDGQTDLRLWQASIMFVAVAGPNAVLLGAFSTIGYGTRVYNAVSPGLMAMLGMGLIGFSCFCIACFYIRCWDMWGPRKKKGTAMIPAFGFFSGTMLVGRMHPWAPQLMVMFLIPLLCGFMRMSICKGSKRASFYKTFFRCTVASSILMATTPWITGLTDKGSWNLATYESMANETGQLWKAYRQIEDPMIDNQLRHLEYVRDCGPDKDVSRFSSKVKTDIGADCKSAITVLFTCWAAPLVGCMASLFLGVFALFSGVHLTLKGVSDVARLESMLKRFLGLLALVLMGMYFSTSIAGASVQLGSTLMASFAACLCVLVISMYVEIGPEGSRTHMRKSKLTQKLLQAWHSDWARALFLGAFNVFLPVFFVLNMLRHRVHCDMTDTPDTARADRFTPFGRKMIDQFQTWNWAGIFNKLCLLCELFFVFQVGVAKATYVFLSWLNNYLLRYSYGVVIAMIYVIGYIMFLLPPVPGVPVYVFCGIVVAEQGRQLESVGFARGCAIACVLAWCLKLTACTGQYMIGYCLGKSLRVQALIGVDKIFTRAIEQVLKERGLSVGKVSVLVGGPDWPTSVTCGILRLNIPQMLLGTAPVFFVSSPCVLAGAFLARVVDGEDSIWSALANTFIGLSGVGQMACGFMAVANVTRTIDMYGKELAKPRPEHAAVAALSLKEAELQEHHDEVTKWSTLARWRKVIICCATTSQMFSCFLFAMGGEYCFRSFSVSSDIGAPYEQNGLNNYSPNIVRPFGRGAILLFCCGVLLHVFFAKDVERVAKQKLKRASLASPS